LLHEDCETHSPQGTKHILPRQIFTKARQKFRVFRVNLSQFQNRDHPRLLLEINDLSCLAWDLQLGRRSECRAPRGAGSPPDVTGSQMDRARWRHRELNSCLSPNPINELNQHMESGS
jgi:hypothetical protein